MNKNCAFVAFFILAIVVLGMFLVARNGNDPFVAFWGLFGKLIAFSEGMK